MNNMKLSELVKLKEAVKKLASREVGVAEADYIAKEISHLQITEAGMEFEGQLEIINDHINDSLEKMQTNLKQHYQKMLDSIDQQITRQAAKYFAQGYYEMTFTTEQERELHLMPVPEEVNKVLIGRIWKYSDWRYPGMEIGPRDGEYTSYLVSCDPLYLVDTRHEYLESTKSKFTPEYQACLLYTSPSPRD